MTFARIFFSLLIGTAIASPALAATTVRVIRPHAAAANAAPSWNSEDQYWRDNYRKEPYFSQGNDYRTYEPAYRYGTEAFTQYKGKKFEEIEPQLGAGWQSARGNSTLSWENARGAVQAAYQRVGSERQSQLPSASTPTSNSIATPNSTPTPGAATAAAPTGSVAGTVGTPAAGPTSVASPAGVSTPATGVPAGSTVTGTATGVGANTSVPAGGTMTGTAR